VPRVTILIPVFNGANYLREAIDSALAQSYPNTEVLVVNDGSTDGGETEWIARSYGDRIRYLHKPNGGVATALNVGIQEMSGEYLSWLSHDDVYPPDKLRIQVEYLRENGWPEVVLFGAYEAIDERSRPLGRGVATDPPADSVLAVLATVMNGCTLLVPRRCFEVAGLFNPELRSTQDNEMWLRIVLAGFPFQYIPHVFVRSRQHAEQGSRTMESHTAERERWYRWAIVAMGPEMRAARSAPIARILLAKGHERVFLGLVDLVRRDSGATAAAGLALRVLPAVLARRAWRTVRAVPRVLRQRRATSAALRATP
jgi:glycosyltransferase involved in cell wall biosynthesis